MSVTLFDRNPDLGKLRDEGFDLGLSKGNNHLLVRGIPYVAEGPSVKTGVLIIPLNLSGDLLNPPLDHVVHFIGEQPRDARGNVLQGIVNNGSPQDFGEGLRSDRTFSARPSTPFASYYDKVSTYVRHLEPHAQVLDPTVTARIYPPYPLEEHESIFKYADTASSRSGIGAQTARLMAERVAVVGLGGTGSYVLDFLAKCPIKEIHLFDSDMFSSHNAFRSPGAASLEELRQRPAKVRHHAEVYGKLRRGIVTHQYEVTGDNAEELDQMEFVFLCADGGKWKRSVVHHLVEKGIGFIDVGIDLDADTGAIGGALRVTTAARDKYDHLRSRLSYAEPTEEAAYRSAIQVVELNALNAALAVVKWKQLRGFYAMEEDYRSSSFVVTWNHINNVDPA